MPDLPELFASLDLNNLNTLSISLRLFLATICGGIIGFERGSKRKTAGFRTYILVCIGSALTMMIGQYVITNFQSNDAIGRMGAQVVSGIGFLGAGTIIVTGRHQVKGLTTAAGLWACACMGLAIGVGFYEAALLGCVFIWFVIMVLHQFDDYMHSKAKIVNVYLELESNSILSEVISRLKKRDIKLSEMELIGPENSSTISLTVTLALSRRESHSELLMLIGTIPGVLAAEEI